MATTRKAVRPRAAAKRGARNKAAARRGAASKAAAKRAAAKRGSVDRAAPQHTAAKPDLVIPPALQPVVDAFAGVKHVTVERGWGSNSVALKAKGKIFAMLVRGDLVFKLPIARVDALVAGGATRFDPRGDGRAMKEWVVLPLTTRDRVQLAREAWEFVFAGGA